MGNTTIVVIAALLLSACGSQYVKRDEFDSTIGDLRGTDAQLASDLRGFRTQFSEMTQDLSQKFENYDATIGNLQGRLRVEMTAHFEYDNADLREVDKPSLIEFSDVIRDYDPNVVVTVEGFTDPAGDANYNRQLGLKRANAVRDFLIEDGHLHPERVRAVSYGEDNGRMLKPGAWGDDGTANRRVSLVVDYVGLVPGK
ncbi:MAG: peptidoglycan-associated lipoprotein [Candidatus Azotimanducaceae bacterium]|jgi:peptidoglycan-associated lipoprotein